MTDRSQTSSSPWRRHELLHVAPDVWASAFADCPSLVGLPLVGAWADRGWPVIVRRRAEADDPALVPVGVPLPPSPPASAASPFLLPPEGVLQRFVPAPAARSRTSCRPRLAINDQLRCWLWGARTGVEPGRFSAA